MITDMNSYALQLVHVQEFACLLDLEERRDLVLWVLEQEYPCATIEERFLAMMRAVPSFEVDTSDLGGYSNTPQLLTKCTCCGVAVTDVLCLHCQNDGAK